MSESLLASLLTARDGADFTYYVESHNPEELWQIDDPAALEFALIWMRPIRSSACYDEGFGCDCDPREFVLRGKDGRFKPRYCRIECKSDHPDAEPWMGARYKT